MGQHTREVLEESGFGAEEIEELVASGAAEGWRDANQRADESN